MPTNVLAINRKSRLTVLTTLQLRPCRAKAKTTAKDRNKDHNRRPS
jgi:hypothetical protein